MNNDTVFAIFDSAHDADAAIRALESAGVPPAAITLHPGHEVPAEPREGVHPPPKQHFWARMFGYEPTPADEHDALVYERSLESGASVVAVTGTGPKNVDVTAILEKHNPVDIDAREISFGGLADTVYQGTARVRRYGPDTKGD